MLTSLACVAGLLQTVAAVNGGASGNKPFNYTAGSPGSTMGGTPKYALKSSAYQYTDMGAAESNIDFAPDGSLIYTPALTTAGVGYATSKDAGQTWSQVLPGSMQRPQPVFRQYQNRYFMWSTKGPGLAFQYSDDQGQTFSPPLSGGNFDPMIQVRAKHRVASLSRLNDVLLLTHNLGLGQNGVGKACPLPAIKRRDRDSLLLCTELDLHAYPGPAARTHPAIHHEVDRQRQHVECYQGHAHVTATSERRSLFRFVAVARRAGAHYLGRWFRNEERNCRVRLEEMSETQLGIL